MAYGGMADAMAAKMGGKKKPPKPPSDDAPDGVSVEVEEEPDAEPAEMSSYEDVESSAADEAFDAFKGGDKAGFKTALSQFVEACVKRQMKE